MGELVAGHPLSAWLILTGAVFIFYAVDLAMFGRGGDGTIPARQAWGWTFLWFAMGLSFTAFIYVTAGAADATDYLTGFIIEKSLSLDNVFVFGIILGYLAIPQDLRARVLFWGILGALALRVVFIWIGIALLGRFEWVMYVLGLVLLATAIRLAIQEEEPDPGTSPALRLVRRTMPSSVRRHARGLLVHEDGRPRATPVLAVVVVMTTDLVLAVDSIPAIFAITTDPFIVISANAMSLLGMRALYFVLQDALHRFVYIHYGLALVLGWVAIKLLLPIAGVHVETVTSLLVVVAVLAIAILGSLWVTRHEDPAGHALPEGGFEADLAAAGDDAEDARATERTAGDDAAAGGDPRAQEPADEESGEAGR